MNVVLEAVVREDPRETALLGAGEKLEYLVSLRVNGALRAFTVYLRANVLDGLDAGIIHGDALLEELLRFSPVALNTLYSVVGRASRGADIDLPLVLETDQPQRSATR